MELKRKTIATLRMSRKLSDFLELYREWLISDEEPKSDFEEACDDILENSCDGREALIYALKIAQGEYSEWGSEFVEVEFND